MKNKFDSAYVMGYAIGYHGDEIDNFYKTIQEKVKYYNGWKDGFLMRVKEKEKENGNGI